MSHEYLEEKYSFGAGYEEEKVLADFNLETKFSAEVHEPDRIFVDEFGDSGIEGVGVIEVFEFGGEAGGVSAHENQTEPSGAGYDYSSPQAPPDTGTRAQVILVMTSLGSFRTQFYGSKKAQHFLDCKGVPYLLIDANRDASRGAGSRDQDYLDAWLQMGVLTADEANPSCKYLLPQILFDGISIGREIELQGLEEDGDLDWIIARALCPNCLADRDPTSESCIACSVHFKELVSTSVVRAREIHQYCRGFPCMDDGQVERAHPAPATHYNDIIQHASPSAAPDITDDLTYQNLFGEPPPEL